MTAPLRVVGSFDRSFLVSKCTNNPNPEVAYCNSCWPAVHAWVAALLPFRFPRIAPWLRLGPTPLPLPTFRITLTVINGHHVDDSVASNVRGLPSRLAAHQFIQLAFQSDQALACLRPSDYCIPAKAYSCIPCNDHTGVDPPLQLIHGDFNQPFD